MELQCTVSRRANRADKTNLKFQHNRANCQRANLAHTGTSLQITKSFLQKIIKNNKIYKKKNYILLNKNKK